jgi:hypothetical protein
LTSRAFKATVIPMLGPLILLLHAASAAPCPDLSGRYAIPTEAIFVEQTRRDGDAVRARPDHPITESEKEDGDAPCNGLRRPPSDASAASFQPAALSRSLLQTQQRGAQVRPQQRNAVALRLACLAVLVLGTIWVIKAAIEG